MTGRSGCWRGGEKFFKVKIGTKEQVITVDRLKPAFGFADPAPLSTTPEGSKATVLKTGTRKSLNPKRRFSSRAQSPENIRRPCPGRGLAGSTGPQRDWELSKFPIESVFLRDAKSSKEEDAGA